MSTPPKDYITGQTIGTNPPRRDARHWQELTNEQVPTQPPTPQQYANAGIPWFDYLIPATPLTGSAPLAEVKSVATLFTEKTGLDMSENESFEVGATVKLGQALRGSVRVKSRSTHTLSFRPPRPTPRP